MSSADTETSFMPPRARENCLLFSSCGGVDDCAQPTRDIDTKEGARKRRRQWLRAVDDKYDRPAVSKSFDEQHRIAMLEKFI